MKKSKLSIGLVTSFIAALALSACNEASTPKVTPKKDTIIDFVGYNGKTDTIEVKTGLYDEISDTDEGTKLYYSSILESLIRHEYENISDGNSKIKSYEALKNEASDKVKAAKRTAQDTARDNGTSYDAEWKKVLESHDCETEKDLQEYYLYDLEKTELVDFLSKEQLDKESAQNMVNDYLGVNNNWGLVTPSVTDVEPTYPYHILHVLVKTDGTDANDYTRATINTAQANKLWSVVRDLIENPLTQVAHDKSDDGSAANYGDVGIMNTHTSFYNEFKLGIYAYDTYLSNNNTETAGENDKIFKAFGLDKDATIVTQTTQFKKETEKVKDLIVSEMETNVDTPAHPKGTASIPTVPYDVFKRIGEFADTDKIGTDAPEAGDVALPRNVIFNHYLNFRSPFVITAEDIEFEIGATIGDDTLQVVDHDFSTGEGAHDNNLKIATTNFKPVLIGGVSRNVLTDGDGNVIIGVRSTAGIHFMTMRKSVFKNTNTLVGRDWTSLQDYYTTKIPGEDGYPEDKADGTKVQTYVNLLANTEKTNYTERADDIKNGEYGIETSNFDAAYDYRLYEYLMKLDTVKDHIKFFDDEGEGSLIETNIANYIARLRKNQNSSNTQSINDAWTTYLMQLKDQNFKRNTFEDAMVKTTCAFRFDSTHAADFEKDGVCYVK